jgi:hypothetical protein
MIDANRAELRFAKQRIAEQLVSPIRTWVLSDYGRLVVIPAKQAGEKPCRPPGLPPARKRQPRGKRLQSLAAGPSAAEEGGTGEFKVTAGVPRRGTAAAR